MISYVFLYLFSICKTTQFWYCERRSSFVSCLRFAKTSVFLDGCVLSEFDFPVLILNIFITDSHFPEILIITDPHFQESAEVSRVVYFILYLCINISFQLIQYVRQDDKCTEPSC